MSFSVRLRDCLYNPLSLGGWGQDGIYKYIPLLYCGLSMSFSVRLRDCLYNPLSLGGWGQHVIYKYIPLLYCLYVFFSVRAKITTKRVTSGHLDVFYMRWHHDRKHLKDLIYQH
jgi:hypothetical protein